MVRRLTLLVLLAALAGGVVSGMPLHAPNTKMMKCCDKAKAKAKTRISRSTSLCCAVGCSDPVPTSSASSVNLAPSNISVTESIASQIAELFANGRTHSVDQTRYSREVLSRTFQPKFIQTGSLLI